MSRILVLFLVALSVICVAVYAETTNLVADRGVDENQELTGENSAFHARMRRALGGSYTSRSRKRTKYHRHVTSSKFSSGSDGDMNYERKHHRERGGSSERSRNEGFFKLGRRNNGDSGWNNEDDDW